MVAFIDRHSIFGSSFGNDGSLLCSMRLRGIEINGQGEDDTLSIFGRRRDMVHKSF